MKERDDRLEFKITTNISDGTYFYDGQVANISRSGIMVTEIPKKFDVNSKRCTAVISENGINHKFYMQPRWSEEETNQKVIGFQIISPSLDWIRLIRKLGGDHDTPSLTFS